MTIYLDILRHPRMAALFGAALLARLPIGINGLAIVLFLREQTGSFAVAGAVAAGLAVGTGTAAPFMGRFVDRSGVRMLLPLATAHAAGILALLGLGSADAPTVALVAVALATGASYPPSPSVLRSRFPELMRDDPRLVAPAYALDSILLELTFVCAPLLVAVAVVAIGPEAALVLSAASVLTGVSLFLSALPPEEPIALHDHGVLGALRAPGIHTLVLTMMPIGFAIGALEVSLPAFSHEHSRPELAGVLIAFWAIGSAAGGFVYGARPRRSPLALIHQRLTLLLPLGFVPLLFAPSMAVMALLLLPAGLFIAPILATRNELATAAAPPGTKTEALTWPLTALMSGLALGAAVGGVLIDGSGWRAAAVAAVASAAVGGLVATVRRSALRAALATAASTHAAGVR
jgi:MFS family permease